MPEAKELAPLQDKSVPTSVAASTEVRRIFGELFGQLLKAIFSVASGNIREGETAARIANALYDDASKQGASPHDLLQLGTIKDMICLFASINRAEVFQQEGRFSKAFEELAKGKDAVSNFNANIDEYAQYPDADQTAVSMIRPIFSIFPVLLKAQEASLRADEAGYQGNIPQYRKLLQKAALEYRQAERLPPSLNPLFLNLVSMCATLADRLEAQEEAIGSMKGLRYLYPTGDKVFIIHGHDEAKWRELETLLINEFHLEPVVLKEKPGGGETLIQKFESFADRCCYAFALLTPDDFLKKEGKSYFQPRPNVLFELGWFYGRFGRDRVCILKKADTELPSDLAGILSIDFRDNVDEGFRKIRAELQRLGIVAGKSERSGT